MRIVEASIVGLYVFFLCFAAVSDYRSLRIPNWISIALIGLFAVDLALGTAMRPVLLHVSIAGAVLVGGLVLYSLGWFAGGDVKLLSTVALWAGPEQIVEVLVITALLGGLLAFLILLARRIVLTYGADMTAMRRALPAWLASGLIPYGIAIAVAGVLIKLPG